MKTKIRKLGEQLYEEIEHDEDECPFCEAARTMVAWSEGGVIFFENEKGTVQRCECLEMVGKMAVVDCRTTTREIAVIEITENARQ